MAEHIEFLITNLFHNNSKDFVENLSLNFWRQCENIMNELKSTPELLHLVEELYTENYRQCLGHVFDRFWQEFLESIVPDKANVNAHHRHIFSQINKLYLAVQKWYSNPFIDLMFTSTEGADNSPKRGYIDQLHNILYASFIAEMPLAFSNFLLNTFSFSFDVFDKINQRSKDSNRNSHLKNVTNFTCSDCDYNSEQYSSPLCYCDTIQAGFIRFRNILRNLGIFQRLCGDVIRSVIFTCIEKHIHHLCAGNNFEVSCLDLTLNWFENNLIDWIKLVYLTEAESDEDMFSTIAKNQDNGNDEFIGATGYARNVLVHEPQSNYAKVLAQISSLNSTNIRNFIINTYIYCRMKQLFEIIIDYPYSEAVLLDLHECIKIDPFYRKKFIQTLKGAFESRLLHPGVATHDIIDAYITAIKALRLLDPQGIILQIVCDPVRNYLKAREDTVRCIITSLTNEQLVDLSEPTEVAGNKEVKDDDEQVLDTWKSWVPQPIGVSRTNKAMINADIISMLVNIFDTKDLFVQEYQRLLSQRLLMTFEVNLEMEHRNLELLSLRFGESELHTCEVMLKDIKDSERVSQRINVGEIEESKPNQFETNGLILSQQFWPENLGFTQPLDDMKSLKLPEEVNNAFETFTKAFETIKANRTLSWVHQLGMVKLELELNNGNNVVEFTVRPIQAAIIYQFQKRKLWRISELGEELSLLPSVIRRHIGYWQNVGLLVEVSSDTFLLDEEARNSSNQSNQQSLNTSQEFDNFDVEIADDENRQCHKEDDSRLQIFWNFIDNMLTNLTSLSLDRIFSMLKMFNMQSPEIESLTMHELRQFLDRKVTESKLVYANGHYSLKTAD